MKINRKILESFLGKKVEVKLFDGTIMKGYLQKCDHYMCKNWYEIIPYNGNNILFRVSHITRIKEEKDDK